MALNTPVDLSLGKLGHIAAGNGDSTTETSLNACGRDSGTGETAMWADFRIGGTSLLLDSSSSTAFNGDERVTFKIRPKGDVGIYMGAGVGGTYVTATYSSVFAGEDLSRSYYFEIDESSDGSLYQSRIAENSDNAGDYDATHVFDAGSGGFVVTQDGTKKDKFRWKCTGGA